MPRTTSSLQATKRKKHSTNGRGLTRAIGDSLRPTKQLTAAAARCKVWRYPIRFCESFITTMQSIGFAALCAVRIEPGLDAREYEELNVACSALCGARSEE